MDYGFNITRGEKEYIRGLARKYLEYACLPIMDEREKLWLRHNSLQGERPVIVMEMDTFQEDMLPVPRCESPAARVMEYTLMKPIVNHEWIDDDKVISPYYTVYWKINFREFGMEIETRHAEDGSGRKLGFARKHPITDLSRDIGLLQPSQYSIDREYTMAWKAFVEETIGDILPVKIKNSSLHWHITPSRMVVDLMGLERMMFSMVDYPVQMHELFGFIKEDILNFVKWQEEEGLLVLNNENDYTGAGSYGFSSELPRAEYARTGWVTAKDLWLNMNSQETVGVSPAMFEEFIFPYYYDIAKEFGLVYYGCCEPVHRIWEKSISKLPGLRKVSISPWCDEGYMGNMLRESQVIYSRKPSPNYIGVGSFDEKAFSEHIGQTLQAARGCHLEIIFRDVYTLNGDKTKPGRAIQIAREMIEKMW